jgi:outer membrane protein OmpA-like peptidoglycan-associated protein
MTFPTLSTGVSSFPSIPVIDDRWRGAAICRAIVVGAMLVAAGCAQPPVAPVEASYASTRAAARNVALTVAQQLKERAGQSAMIWVAPPMNLHSGELTVSGRELQVMLALDLKSLLGHSVVQSLGGRETTAWDWVVASTVEFERPSAKGQDESWFRIVIHPVDPAGDRLPGMVARVNAYNFDPTPSRFFRDAPMFLTGAYHRARQEFAKGHLSSLPVAERNRFLALESLLQDAIASYEDGRYAEALQQFTQLLKLDPENLSALSGKYQSLHAIGDASQADAALAMLMDTAVRQGVVSVRFLFGVRSVEFRDDLDIARQYLVWLRHLARAVLASGQCLTVLGHASRSGGADLNQQLSLARAQRIANELVRAESGL